MGGLRSPWGLSGALLATSYLHSICASASPSINVGLKTSWASAPYLLELLETAADENATSYFPLLDRIADGRFSEASTDKELYEQFTQVLKEDGHMSDPETLSSYQLALSMRSSAPRIEAHYQYYHTAVQPSFHAEEDVSCPIWVLFNGKQYCSPALEEANRDIGGASQTQKLHFDRVLGSPLAPASVLYADITSPTFGQFHKILAKTALEGKTSYRIRHRKALAYDEKPLIIPGYGVELQLKRTDYIVIDDREGEASKLTKAASETEVKFEDEGFADLKPLSTSELFSLAVKASSFIMQSEKPFDTLVKLSQDFPKYSSAVASHNATEDFLMEHAYNRGQLVPAGYNIWWMNGVQLIERQVEALSMLDMMRKERKLIKDVRDLGLTSQEAIQLLSHNEVSTAKAENEPQRFDWRDELEGGKVIVWMNDIEKDKRYEGWPSALSALLQRTYPGQLPTVRRECFHLVLPVDFAEPEDVRLVVDTMLSFVKRKLAIRIGLVPITDSLHGAEQAAIIYHLLDAYGLTAVISYLENSYSSKKLTSPHKASFESAVEGRRLRLEKTAHSLEDALKSEDYQKQIQASQKWIRRLAANSKIPPMFVDGVAIPRDENYLQAMSTRVTTDLQAIQQAVFSETFEADTWLPTYFLQLASAKRNALVVPEDEKTLRIYNVNKLVGENQELLTALPRVDVDPSSAKQDWAHMILVADLDSEAGGKLLTTATLFRETNPSVELVIVHNPTASPAEYGLSNRLYSHMRSVSNEAFTNINALISVLSSDNSGAKPVIQEEADQYWHTTDSLVKSMSLRPGENGLLLNGRLVGPIPDAFEFDEQDFEQLLTYERSKRIAPTLAAMQALGLTDKIASPLSAAKISSIVALSTISDAPDGIFEQGSPLRMSQFDVWNSSHTVIETGNKTTATIHMTLLVDPASQQGAEVDTNTQGFVGA